MAVLFGSTTACNTLDDAMVAVFGRSMRDQASFDPDYRSEPLETFTPMVREVFARKAYDPAVIREGEVTGLPALSG